MLRKEKDAFGEINTFSKCHTSYLAFKIETNIRSSDLSSCSGLKVCRMGFPLKIFSCNLDRLNNSSHEMIILVHVQILDSKNKMGVTFSSRNSNTVVLN